MLAVASGLLMAMACLLLAPALVLVVEVIAALSYRERLDKRSRAARPRVAVIVPAHDESIGLLPTIADIKRQLAPADRLLVVADNCSDDTADVARGAGAEVAIRHDLNRVGKGYALDCGLRYLAADLPEIVIIIDADCAVADSSIDQLAMTCAETGRPVQALYLMEAPEQSAINYRVAMFAWRVKNYVRPLGLKVLNCPCQLMGSGMAFPRDILGKVNLASGHLVEDLQLGLDLASAGSAPLFCPSAIITSRFPTTAAGSKDQRQRWERGHLSVIVKQGFRLLFQAILFGKFDLLVLAIDMAIPPLAVLGTLLMGNVILAAIGGLFGLSPAALMVATAGFTLFVAAVFFSWWKFAADVLPAQSLWLVLPYLLEKRRLYARMVPTWVRTDRGLTKETVAKPSEGERRS